MTDRDMDTAPSDIDDLDLALALRRLASAADVPPIDPAREAALLADFDAAWQVRGGPRTARIRRPYWGMAGLAAAAALLIVTGVTGLVPIQAGRHGSPKDGRFANGTPPSSSRGVQQGPPDDAVAAAGPNDAAPRPPGEFVVIPGALGLPPMESGTLVRIEVPVSMLPSYGLRPPASPARAVKADVIVAQDGLPRAARLVE